MGVDVGEGISVSVGVAVIVGVIVGVLVGVGGTGVGKEQAVSVSSPAKSINHICLMVCLYCLWGGVSML